MDKGYKNRLEKNFFKYNLATVFGSASRLWIAFLFLFYSSLNLNLTQIGILGAIFSLSAFIFEIPSGIFADKFGRKNSLVLAGIFAIFASLFWLFSNSFWTASLGAIFYGLTWAFRSGADVALIFDSHKELKKENLFRKFISKNLAYELITTAIFFIIGGFLTAINFRLIFVISTLFAVMDTLVLLTLKEPKAYKKIMHGHSKQFIYSLKEILSDKKIILIFLNFLIISSIINGIYKYHQLLFKEVGFSLTLVGFIYALMYLVAAFFSYNGEKIERKIGYRISIIIVPIILSASYFIMGLGFTFFFAFFVLLESIIAGYYQPLITDLQNRYVSSSKRATIGSIFNLAKGLTAGIIGILFGYSGNLLGINYIYILAGVIILFIGTFLSEVLAKETSNG